MLSLFAGHQNLQYDSSLYWALWETAGWEDSNGKCKSGITENLIMDFCALNKTVA